jgi:uncharacterized protein (UPF0335 family)
MREGHNGLDGISAEQLCGYVSRVERVQEEIDGLNDDKKEIFGEAKSLGFDVPTIKKVIQRRRKDRQELNEEDQLLTLYEDIINRLLAAQKEVDPLA